MGSAIVAFILTTYTTLPTPNNCCWLWQIRASKAEAVKKGIMQMKAQAPQIPLLA